MPNTRIKRLPPEIREMICKHISSCGENATAVSIAEIIHILADHHRSIELSEPVLKNLIAAAAVERGLVVAFDGT